MVKKTIKSSIVASIVLGSMMAPTALAQRRNDVSNYHISKHQIIFNGKVVSNPYGFPALDPNTGRLTTYMPLWYVMQALKSVGTTYTWNGHQLNVITPPSMKVDLSNLRPGNEASRLEINGTLVQTSPKIAMRDPYSHVFTTYQPIFYVMDLLHRLGVQSVWKHGVWSMTLNEASSITVSAAQSTVAQGKADDLSVAVRDTNGNTMTVPASAIKWTVSNSTDGFVSPSGQFLATQPGTYQVTANYNGVASQPVTITVVGTTAKVALSASGSFVADGQSPTTVNVKAMDSAGNVATDENGTVTISDTQGWLVTGSSNGKYSTDKSATVQLKNGEGTVQVLAPTTAGLSDSLTSGALSDAATGSNVDYGTLSVQSVAQAATSLQVTPVNGQKYLVANVADATALFHVTVLDQNGAPMLSGTYPFNISVTGPATYNGASTGVFVGGQNPIPITVTGKQGSTGTITVSVTGQNLKGGSTSIQAVIAQAATGLVASNSDSTNSFAEGSTLSYTLSAVDSNGYPSTFPTTPLTAYVTNASGQPATNITVNGQAEGSGGVSLGSKRDITIGDLKNGPDAGTYSLVMKDTAGHAWLTRSFTETPADASQLTLTPTTSEVTEANSTADLTITMADTYGNAVIPSSPANILVKAKGDSGSATINGQPVTSSGVTVTTGSNGQADVRFQSQSPAGTSWTLTATSGNMTSHSATVKVMNSLVSNATLTIADANGSTAQATAGDQLKFTFGATDNYGNPYQGNDQFDVSYPTGALTGVQGGQDRNGTTTVTGTLSQLASDFANVKVGTAQTLQVTLSDQSVSSAHSGTATLQVVPGDFAGYDVFNGSNQLISSTNPLPVTANTPEQVLIRPVDAYGNPVSSAPSTIVVDLSDNGANGYFRTTPSGANVTQVSIPVGMGTVPVYYINASSKNVVLSAGVSMASAKNSSVTVGAFTAYQNGHDGTGTLTVTLRDAANQPVTGQASQLSASVTNGNGVTVGAFTEINPGVYTAPITSTANNTGVTITVKDGNTSMGTSAPINS